jgi:hypothetical protein
MRIVLLLALLLAGCGVQNRPQSTSSDMDVGRALERAGEIGRDRPRETIIIQR